MNEKTKYFLIPFTLMIIFNLGARILLQSNNFGAELNPHLGILFTSGLFFGPYGILGAIIANLLCNIINGYSLSLSIISKIVGFIVIYLGYKMWFSLNKNQTPRIRLNSTRNLLYFFLIVFVCGMLYSLLVTKLISLTYPNTLGLRYTTGIRYFINFVNFSLLFSILLIWLSRVKNFTYTPKSSDKKYDPKKYRYLFIILVISSLMIILIDRIHTSYLVNLIETAFLVLLTLLYVTKPITAMNNSPYISIPEKIMDTFLAIILFVVVFSIIDLYLPYEEIFLILSNISANDPYILILSSLDIQILIILIPSYFIIGYIENKVVKPILSFSKIESRIQEDKKIDVEDLINVYSKYSNQEDEIGMLSRSYINLIKYNNNYIENIKKIETEKQRIQTELDIAYKIQKSILPTKSIKTEDYFVTGLSRPAKEVGGDFFDYFESDEEHLVIVIGDSSGKGVPAALFSTIVQNSIQQHMLHDNNPATILSEINNQICKKNTEYMFITLWLGIYNRKTHKLVYSNGGHNPPMIKKDGKYTTLETEPNIVLGLEEDFIFTKQDTIIQEELLLYTDGVTDAQNDKKELYGTNNLLKILNDNKFNEKNIGLLLDDLDRYMGKEEQYDDITVTYLKVLK